MAAALSSSFLASSLSSLRTESSRSFRPAPRLNSFLDNPLSRSSSVSLPSSRGGSISRKLYQVRATRLKEKEEKVMVEESFQAKTLLETERKEMDAELSGNESGIVERWVIKFEQSVNVLLTESVIKILDALYRDRHYARFFVLETVARVPYFAFISVLHMYESFGWWRRADYLKVHFAESWNELHHLLIMEELGGNAFWFDRFLAQHIAIFYYFMTAFMYALSPRMACYVDFGNNQCPIIHISTRNLPKEGRKRGKMGFFLGGAAAERLTILFSLEVKNHFSECVEKHAYSTYDKFLKLQGEELKKLPAPQTAIKYYMNEDLYLFDEFQTARTPNTRRPKIENLYDVFVNIRDDEGEHCKTMKACQTPGNLQSPHSTESF